MAEKSNPLHRMQLEGGTTGHPFRFGADYLYVSVPAALFSTGQSNMSFRPVKTTSLAKPTMEGAGVHLHRAFGFTDPTMCDPFLMLDDFRNDVPAHYQKGFPWHPHRGIETITYVLDGEVEHADSLGNRGVLGPGSVQWMTAGSGILHQEMPRGNSKGQMHGFQLWANLPSSLKMTAPRYQDIQGADIPEIIDDDGTRVRVIVGEFWGKRGPVDGIAANPVYLDVTVPPLKAKRLPVDTYTSAFAYVFQGAGKFEYASAPEGVRVEKEFQGEELNIRDLSGNRTLIRFDTGDEVFVQAGPEGVRFLLVTGKPIREPVAWHGPIVMNTREELIQAINELNNGTFIKPAH
jgi:redox-sensitive bicupin YhaK (pirin superfamily)